MSATERRKGAAWELSLVHLLREQGWIGAERTGGGHDQRHGDLLGVPGWHLEAKCCRAHDLSGWVDTAAARNERFAVLVKRRGKTDPGCGYAVTSIRMFLRLLREAGY